MGYAIYQDMEEIYQNPDKWINHGEQILISSCKHKDGFQKKGWCEKCDISEDSAIPIINYLYPLECSNFDDSKILKVVKDTNCTILENSDSGEWFLALCGGGMDLSQDIALSYIILERWIPEDLILSVCKQRDFSIGGKDFEILKKAIIEQSGIYKNRFEQLEKDWKAI